MSTYIKNYGITKTFIKDNDYKLAQEIQWMGDYDGQTANIRFNIDDDGSKKFVSMQLDNNDLIKLLGVQSIQMPLEERLSQKFLGEAYKYKPITLEGALIKKKTRKHRRHHKKYHKKHRSSKKRTTYKI